MGVFKKVAKQFVLSFGASALLTWVITGFCVNCMWITLLFLTFALHSLHQCFLTFFGFIHPCHRLLHSHSPYCEYMTDATIIIMHRVVHCWTTVFAVLYPQHAFLHATNWLRYSNMVWLQTQLHKMFFFVTSAHALFEEEIRGFLRAESFTADEWREFHCLLKYSCCCLKNCGAFW